MLLNKGFTLAEILITLAVIGVVAALTIPTLVQNQQEKATVAQVREAYSILNQAYAQAIKDNGSPETWGMAWNNYMNFLKPYFKIAKDCSNGSTGCFPAGVTYYYLRASYGTDGIIDSLGTWMKLKLANGMLVTGALDSPTCVVSMGSTTNLQNECGRLMVDVNGEQGPNQYGKDTFWFFFTRTGVYPAGSAQATVWRPFNLDCKDIAGNSTGAGCTAWVIYNGNQDYLHCNYLDWGGKTTCN